MSVQGAPVRTVGQLFRDCLRLVNHISGHSAKGANLRRIVGGEFRKNMKEEDPERIEALKGNAIRALSNYLMMSSLSKDETFKSKAGDFNERTLRSTTEEQAAERTMEADYAAALAEQQEAGKKV